MSTDERLEQARLLYERAVFGGDAGGLATAERELDGVEADLALARGRLVHARFLEQRREDPQELALFQRAAQLYSMLGDARGEGEALFWVGTFHQVVRGDNEIGVPALERSYELAARVGDNLTMSYALRHLGIAEQSVRLRREVGFLPGVAANLVGLAYIAAGEGRRDDALRLLDDAGTIADSSGAQGISRSVQQARAEI